MEVTTDDRNYCRRLPGGRQMNLMGVQRGMAAWLEMCLSEKRNLCGERREARFGWS